MPDESDEGVSREPRPETVILGRAAVAFSALDDEHLAIDVDKGFAYSLNPTAMRVWELIEQPISFGALCALLADEFEVDAAVCRTEVAGLVGALAEAGLIELR